jgi:ERCC4-type nuclease
MNNDKIVVIVDSREFKSKVVVELSNLGILIEQQQLDVGDYVVSDRCGIERKEVDDFLQSLIDKRLFSQVKRLAQAYPRPLMILEGEGLFTKRRMSVEAIMGALSSITVSFKLPIISTRDGKETAKFIAVLAKKEYQAGQPVGTRGQKGYMSMKERQEFLVEGLPNVSVTIAKRLLAHFGTIEDIINATLDELCEVQGVGKHTAKEIREVLEATYPEKKVD